MENNQVINRKIGITGLAAAYSAGNKLWMLVTGKVKKKQGVLRTIANFLVGINSRERTRWIVFYSKNWREI